MLWWEEGGCRLDRAGRVSHMNKDLKEVRKSAMELSGERMSKTEGIAKTKGPEARACPGSGQGGQCGWSREQ